MMSNKVKKALISVSDKQEVIRLAQALQSINIEIISTGGTAKYLQQHGIATTEISTVTNFPEIMNGRVKSLHPKIQGGILSRGDQDAEIMQQQNINSIDLIIVNLYPFAETISNKNCTIKDAIENIDIGGPTMIRAAAKNFNYKTVVVDPQDYSLVIDSIDQQGFLNIDETIRLKLATKAFTYTANYENHIANYFTNISTTNKPDNKLPDVFTISYNKKSNLRYGENPHQQAALYTPKIATGIAAAKQIQGKELSFNNIVDADTAWQCLQQFTHAACVIVKHANPCGVAVANNINQAYNKAFKADPVSAFGGIIAINQELDGELASTIINNQFAEVIIAPTASQQALTALQQKPNIRLLTINQTTTASEYNIQSIGNSLLVQQQDIYNVTKDDIKTVTKKSPTDQQLLDLLFAWKVAKFVKSNAIVYAKDQQSIGIGAGQMSRIYSAKIANIKATDHQHNTTKAVMASDAFFPFRDSIDTASSMGISAIIQPGGSIRDDEVIAAADEANIVMMFTNTRHFRH
jgi:phosphoribosylaminoimidazolecarboxamide formyltransferase/IMP cyclohydrolase